MAYLQNRVASASTGAPNPLVKNDTKTVGGVEYGVDPYRNTATALTPPVQKPVPDAFGPNGEPVFYTEQGGLVRPGSGTVGPDVAASRIERRENASGDPTATNPRSTAAGPGMFIDSTWLDTVKTARPELAKSLSDKQILALRNDPDFAHEMTTALATQNADALTKAKLPVTTASLALAHTFGAAGATKILNAAPGTRMEELFPPKTVNGKTVDDPVITANPELKGQTAGSYAQALMKSPVGNDPVATGDQSQPGQIFHKGQFDKPQLVETDDGKGGTWRGMAQQNNRTGQWVTADDKRTPIDSTNMVIIPESMGAGGGGRFAGQVIRIMTSAKQATAELGNLVQLHRRR